MERVCSSSVGLWMKTEVLIKQRISNDAGNRQAGRVSRSDPSQNLLKFVCRGIQLFSTPISRLALLLRRDDTAFFSALCGTNSVIPTTMSLKPPVLLSVYLWWLWTKKSNSSSCLSSFLPFLAEKWRVNEDIFPEFCTPVTPSQQMTNKEGGQENKHNSFVCDATSRTTNEVAERMDASGGE